ncbi:helix-turn-helix domain-containing protein [Rhodococcus sp. 1163]|uniref:helix-turn-helix transcriptional regulator n=1 Tax=Rhodococcus sp. 1163 TaxID=1905289 RepID=UPI00117AEE91
MHTKGIPENYAARSEAARILGCSQRTVERHILAGRLKSYRLGLRYVVVDLDEVRALAQNLRTPVAIAA